MGIYSVGITCRGKVWFSADPDQKNCCIFVRWRAKPTHRVHFTVALPCRPCWQRKTNVIQLKERENDARTQLDIPQNIMMRILDESRKDKFMLQECTEKFIGHRAVAGDSSLTDKFECVMPAAAGDESQTHISNDEPIRFTSMIIQ